MTAEQMAHDCATALDIALRRQAYGCGGYLDAEHILSVVAAASPYKTVLDGVWIVRYGILHVYFRDRAERPGEVEAMVLCTVNGDVTRSEWFWAGDVFSPASLKGPLVDLNSKVLLAVWGDVGRRIGTLVDFVDGCSLGEVQASSLPEPRTVILGGDG